MQTAISDASATAQHQRTGAFGFRTLLLVGLSLSIGWGIRGNFGHEYGAAFAGCLAALTVCLASGRTDWQEKVLYFGFFGAIGWGFGGSISYMQVISFTESGHLPSQLYGYACLFIIGFLWAALGGAGTTLAAVAERTQLSGLIKPVLFVFGAWFVQDLIEDPLASALQEGIAFDHTWSRHKSPLYWFDSDYLAAVFALLGVGLYDLTERRERNGWLLPVFGLVGAAIGWLVQQGLQATGLDRPLADVITYSLGDASYLDPATGQPAFTPDNFLNNWPQWFGDYPQHIGWVAGLLMGGGIYFWRFGRFRDGASLIVYMALGWLISFMVFPVLGSLFFTKIGGLRMTPPRGDDWAGILGVFLGMIVWMRRHHLSAVAVASIVSGTIGGLGFSGIQWVKQLMMALGNPRIISEKGIAPGSAAYNETVAQWANWQQQNWHSFLEQTYGFVNGLAIAVALGMLVNRLPLQPQKASATPRWTLGVTAFFVLIGIPYVNLIKNVKEWSEQLNPAVWQQTIAGADGATETVPALWDVPYLGRLPGVDFLRFTPEGWYKLTWLLLAATFIILVRHHLRQPVAIIPRNWLGKGQLVFVVLLWIMVIGNFERALVGWHPGRLLTEWVITLNALIATVLVLLLPDRPFVPRQIEPFTDLSYQRIWLRTALVFVVAPVCFVATNRLIYQYPAYDKLDVKTYHTRFGPQASWRAKPNLKNAPHK